MTTYRDQILALLAERPRTFEGIKHDLEMKQECFLSRTIIDTDLQKLLWNDLVVIDDDGFYCIRPKEVNPVPHVEEWHEVQCPWCGGHEFRFWADGTKFICARQGCGATLNTSESPEGPFRLLMKV